VLLSLFEGRLGSCLLCFPYISIVFFGFVYSSKKKNDFIELARKNYASFIW